MNYCLSLRKQILIKNIKNVSTLCKSLYTKEANVANYESKPVVFGRQTLLVFGQLLQNGSSSFKYWFIPPQLGEMGDEGVLELDGLQKDG